MSSSIQSYHHNLQQFSSVAQSCRTLCDSMDCSMPGLPVHHQLPVYSNWCPLSWWCHPIISSSVVPFSSHLQSLPASGSFQMSQFFMSGGQSIGVSALIGRIVALQRCLCPDPWSQWTCFRTWQNRFYRGDEGSWDGEITLDYQSGPNIITGSL